MTSVVDALAADRMDGAEGADLWSRRGRTGHEGRCLRLLVDSLRQVLNESV